MKIKKLIFTIIAYVLAVLPAMAQQTNKNYKEADLKSGVLDNGMHYYIMHNEEPENRASFYFAQNVGSILENDEQQGLAHFLEHMAFNGTQNFEDKGMLDYLQKNGIKFGSEINAFTSFDETVYNINRVPVTNEKLIDSVLLIMHDWSGYLSLKDEEIDAERGVVNEEWRSRNTPGARASKKMQVEGILAGSKYAHRFPIGKMDIVNNFEYDELRDYYAKWYRPDQQAVIIVGDIDVVAVEQKVKKVFGEIPLKKGLPKRDTFSVNINDDLIYLTSTDKELGEPSIDYFIRRKSKDLSATEDLKANLLASVGGYIFNNRLSELTQEPSSPALSVSFNLQEFVRPIDFLSVSVTPKKDSLVEALNFSLTEFKRFENYGATPEELQRAKLALRSSLENAKKNIDKRHSDTYASALYNAFFDQKPILDYSWELDYELDFLEDISNEQLLDFLSNYKAHKGEVVSIIGGDSYEYPEETVIKNILSTIENTPLDAYTETGNDKKLINTELPGATVVDTHNLDWGDAEEVTLSNGMKLILFPTDFDKEQVYMSAFSPGGSSRIAQEKLDNVFVTPYLASNSGLGKLNNIELNKLLAGTNTSVSVGINGNSEQVSGSSTLTDLEILFKRVYLSFTEPRFDAQVFDLIKQNLNNSLIAKKKNVASEFQDSLQLASVNHSKRAILFDQRLVNEISLEGIKEVYKDRFNNASDFTFVFVGDFDKTQLLEFAKKYLGSIPGTHKTETYINHHMVPKPGMNPVHIAHEMETPQTTVNITYSGAMKYSAKKSLEMYMLGQLLSKRYMERIREDEGGSYGVSAGGSLEKVPAPRFSLNVSFKCNPDKADKLVDIVYEELEDLTTSIDEVKLNEVKNNIKKLTEEGQKTNQYWLSKIVTSLQLEEPIANKETIFKRIDAITSKDLKHTMQEVLENPAIVEGILMPEKKAK